MSGKSFWVLDAAGRVCRGMPVLGRRSNPCGILYIASEDGDGIRSRIAGLRGEIGPLGPRFRFIGQAPNLTSDEDVGDLRATLGEVGRTMASDGVRLGVVIVDTFSASTPGADENSAKDMGPVLSALQTLSRELRLLVIVVHHTGKSEDRGMRGWSGFLANADGVISLEARGADGLCCGTVVKVKNGEAGGRFGFTLDPVGLGVDMDGDAITTCVVCEADAPSRGGARGRPKLTARQAIMLRALHLCVEAGQLSPVLPGPGISPDTMGVLRPLVKERAMREGFTDGDEPPQTVRRALNEAISGLIAKQQVRCQGDHLWPVP
jgi:hypothetical protein